MKLKMIKFDKSNISEWYRICINIPMIKKYKISKNINDP